MSYQRPGLSRRQPLGFKRKHKEAEKAYPPVVKFLRDVYAEHGGQDTFAPCAEKHSITLFLFPCRGLSTLSKDARSSPPTNHQAPGVKHPVVTLPERHRG